MTCFHEVILISDYNIYELYHEKILFLEMRKQRRRSAARQPRGCFRYIDSIIPLILKWESFKPLAIFCDCTAQFVSDLVESFLDADRDHDHTDMSLHCDNATFLVLRVTPISPTPVSPTPVSPMIFPVSPTPISPTPVSPTLKFYLCPVSPTLHCR